eukprot:COSAG04_NODE_3606_length_2676_cov_1.369810_4_plen_412_part_00
MMPGPWNERSRRRPGLLCTEGPLRLLPRAMADALPAVDGYACWLWAGGAEAQACARLAATLHAPAAREGAAAGELEGAAGALTLCAETEEFRLLARALPRRGWFCLDIGAAHGHATEALAAACGDGGPEGGRAVGVEKGHDFVTAARAERPGLRFERLDALAAPQYLLQLATGADCLAIDINGVRELEALAPLLALALRVIKPRLVLVKSRRLCDCAVACTAPEQDERPEPEAPEQDEGRAGALAVDGARWWATVTTAVLAAQPPDEGAEGGPLRMRSARRYPLNYPRRYAPTLLPTAAPDRSAGEGPTERQAEPEQAGQDAEPAAARRQQQQQGVQEGGVRICEFHNYDPAGCKKGARGACELDHAHCHFCGAEGHRALECPEQLATDAAVLAAMLLRPCSGDDDSGGKG